MDVGDRVKFVDADDQGEEIYRTGAVADVEDESRGFVIVQDDDGNMWTMHVERIEEE